MLWSRVAYWNRPLLGGEYSRRVPSRERGRLALSPFERGDTITSGIVRRVGLPGFAEQQSDERGLGKGVERIAAGDDDTGNK